MNTDLTALVQVALPEAVLGTAICLTLLAGLFAGRFARDVVYVSAVLSLLVTAWAVGAADTNETLLAPGGALVVDAVARLLKLFALAVTAVVFVYARPFLGQRSQDSGDYYLLALFAVLGILVMISAASFLTMYLGIEMLSLALYALVASERDAPLGAEAGMKYFVLGAIASGCLLYGISLVYAATGTIDLADVAAALGDPAESRIGAIVGLVFILVGIAFKFGAVPFHAWLPDVYQGANAAVTLFVATAPKVAAFALAFRLLSQALAPLADSWQLVLAWLAILSLGFGNVLAIAQTNFKRMLAYSTIAHVGFILLGFVAGNGAGVESALFYTIIYVIMTAGAFGGVILLSVQGREAGELDDLRGLNRRSPWFAAVMLLLMVSMIGVPPLAGFYAKWWVLSALLDAGETWLVIAGVVFSVIGAFYYLRVIWLMYFDEGVVTGPVQQALDLRILLSINGLAVLGLGLFPGSLMDLCARVLT